MEAGKTIIRYAGGGFDNNREAGGAGMIIETGEYVAVLDWGLSIYRIDPRARKPWEGKSRAFGPDKGMLPKGRNIDLAIGSHLHMDHIGGFPLIIDRMADSGKIWVTPQTYRAMEWVYEQNLKHQPDLYHVFDVADALRRRAIIPRPGKYTLVGKGDEFFFGADGHVPGAMYVFLVLPSGEIALVINDYADFDQPVIGASDLPDDVPDDIIQRCSYILGTDLAYPTLSAFDWDIEFAKAFAAKKQHLEKGHIVIDCVFAQARAHNVALKTRDFGIAPVYVDGSAQQFFEMYLNNRWSDKDKVFSMEGIRFIESREQREKLIERGGPLNIMSSGGMGEGGPMDWYMDVGLERDDFAFFLNGYVTEDSRGGGLLKAVQTKKNPKITYPDIDYLRSSGENLLASEEEILEYDLPLLDASFPYARKQSRVITLRADVKQFRLSAHGGLAGVIRIARKITERRGKKIKLIVETHGPKSAKAIAKSYLSDFAERVVSDDEVKELIL